MVTVKNLTVKIDNKTLLFDVSCTITPGRITVFIGKSGAGKTTLLKTVVGLIPFSSGAVLIEDKNLRNLSAKERAQRIGYVAQDFNLFSHYTLFENCLNPLLLHSISESIAHDRVTKLLKEFEIEMHRDKYPGQLSGGQKQRGALARALCLNPHILLLDEPTASLDPHTTEILIEYLKKLVHKGLTIAVSSQDMLFVEKIIDRIYLINDGAIVDRCENRVQLAECARIKKFINNR